MRIALIAAIGRDHAIAIGNDLPWHLPDDVSDFRRKIKGHMVLMGRVTYEVIGHPLKDSPTMVITRNTEYQSDAIVFHTISEGIQFAQQSGEKMLFILGGQEIYTDTLNLATDLYLTHVEDEFKNATTFFPEVNWSQWIELASETIRFEQSERNSHSFVVKHYRLKNCSADEFVK